MGTRMNGMAGLVALVACLALIGCGQSQPGGDTPAITGEGTLHVASTPAGEVFVDGTSHGTAPVELTLTAGTHEIQIRRAKFDTWTSAVEVKADAVATVDAGLSARIADDPEVLLALATGLDTEYPTYAAPEVHRGRGSDRLITIIWPQRDVRLVGLNSYCMEISTEYEPDGMLEFRRRGKTLYSQPFEPASMTVVAALPQEVQDQLKPGDKIKWGVYYDDRRLNVTSEFHVVRASKADRGLEKLESSKHFRRQPPLTRDLLRAAKLENYRLYSEALIYNLDILARNPDSIQPMRGIVTTLRRLDAEDTGLWGVASQYVDGNRTGRTNAGIGPIAVNNFGRQIDPRVPRDIAGYVPRDNPLGAHDSVAPGPQPTEPGITEPPGVTVPGPQAGALADRFNETQRAADQAAQVADAGRQQADEAATAVEAAQQQLESARAQSEQAEQSLGEAQVALETATAGGDQGEIDAAQQAVEAAQQAVAMARETEGEAGARAQAAASQLATATKVAQQAAQEAERAAQEAELARTEAESSGVAIPDTGVPVNPDAPSAKDAALRAKRIATLQHQVESTQQMVDELTRVQAELEAQLDGMPEGSERTGVELALEHARQQAELARASNLGAAEALAFEQNGGQPLIDVDEETADPLPKVDPKQAQIEAKELAKFQTLAQTHQSLADQTAAHLAEMEVSFADVLATGTDDEKASAELQLAEARERAAIAADLALNTQRALAEFQRFLEER